MSSRPLLESTIVHEACENRESSIRVRPENVPFLFTLRQRDNDIPENFSPREKNRSYLPTYSLRCADTRSVCARWAGLVACESKLFETDYTLAARVLAGTTGFTWPWLNISFDFGVLLIFSLKKNNKSNWQYIYAGLLGQLIYTQSYPCLRP